MTSLTAINEVSERYNQKLEDVENWFHVTEWSTNSEVSEKMLHNMLHTLRFLGIIEGKPSLESLVDKLD